MNAQTKDYLGYNNSNEQENECNTSSSNSDYDSDSDDIYQPGIQRSLQRLVPQIAEPDDDIYGEFDSDLTISQYEMVSNQIHYKSLKPHVYTRGKLKSSRIVPNAWKIPGKYLPTQYPIND